MPVSTEKLSPRKLKLIRTKLIWKSSNLKTPDTLKTQMKACTLWGKDISGHMVEVKLNLFSLAVDKIAIDAVIPTPDYPDNSKNGD
jgi:hypothetical protein